MNWNYLAIIVNSALYLTTVFIAGMVTGHDLAWKLAVATFGLCYLTPAISDAVKGAESVVLQSAISSFFFLSSVALGAAAGIALLI